MQNPYLLSAARRVASPMAGTPAAAPAVSSTVQDAGYGSYGGQVPDAGQFTGRNGVRKTLKRLYAGNAVAANQGLWGQINNLQNDMGQDWQSIYARQAAPAFERLNDYQNAAQGNLTSNLAARGLDDSSAMAAGLGTLGAQGAAARSGLANTVTQQAIGREDQDRSQLMGILQGLVGGGMNAAQIQSQLAQERMQQQMMQGDPFGEALGGLFSLGGAALGSPWLGKYLGGR